MAAERSSRHQLSQTRVHDMPTLPAGRAKRLVELLLNWFRANARDLPWRRTRDPYGIWISEVMLQQTQVKTVIPYWERWMGALPDVPALAAAPSSRVLKLWEGLGYYTRARNLQRAARRLIAFHKCEQNHASSLRPPSSSHRISIRARPSSRLNGFFPHDYDTLLTLPGIGRYTAGAICSIAFNQPKPVLDGNVTRVFARLFGLGANSRKLETVKRLWKLAERFVETASELPDRWESNCSHLNQSLMELGATVCMPRQPACPACPLRRFCIARRQGNPERFPHLSKRTSVKDRTFQAFLIEWKGTVLVHRRPAGEVNGALWEFPNAEAASWRKAARALDLKVTAVHPFTEVRHSITRNRIQLRVWKTRWTDSRLPPRYGYRWVNLAAARRLPFTAAHRRILDCWSGV